MNIAPVTQRGSRGDVHEWYVTRARLAGARPGTALAESVLRRCGGVVAAAAAETTPAA